MAAEEEVLGKAYDSRLMKRLLSYLRPYKWQVTTALISIVLKSAADVAGPLLTLLAVDIYLMKNPGAHPVATRYLSPDPLHGINADLRRVCRPAAVQLLPRIPANLLHAVDRARK